ncbi:retrovirus-related pol polyprotein from transposon TNT 1-94 [Tanacetum coccineum]
MVPLSHRHPKLLLKGVVFTIAVHLIVHLCLNQMAFMPSSVTVFDTYATQASPLFGCIFSICFSIMRQCHVNTNTPNWHVDSGATDHMTPAYNSLHHSSPYPEKLLSVSKLTTDHPVDVLFSQPFFYIHDRKTKRVLARGRCEHGLYVLKDEPTAFIATAKVIKPASYELWHARLGHVSFDVISTLNKLGVLSITSLLLKPIICTPCQLAKGQRLPFTINAKRSSHPLDLIHYDLWGPAPLTKD